MLTITLTFTAILTIAIVARLSGSATDETNGLTRALNSRAVVGAVFVVTFIVLWYSWAAWNPIPVVHDEMAYVLQAEIFARGRWALSSPPIPAFWEQPHVLVEPILTSKYFPGHSLAMTPGALVGWPALIPLLLHSTSGALLYTLARRVANAGVAIVAWVVWLFAPMVLYFGPTYFSEATTTTCWLSGAYALLQWRTTRRRRWLLAVAFFTGWCAITRPLTGVAYAIPVAFVVMRDVLAERRWRDLAAAFALGVAVIGILPVWSAHTTGDWRVTPHTLYTRMYMPYDVLGFGVVTTPPTHTISPDLLQINNVYRSAHVDHFPSTLLKTLIVRARYLAISLWRPGSGILGVFAVLGLLSLTGPVAFAVAGAVLLVVIHLAYATPPQWTLYYYESVPVFAYLTAAGLACAVSMLARPRPSPWSPALGWRSPRWTRALSAGALVLALPGLAAVRTMHGQHIQDRGHLKSFEKLLATIHDPRAVVFVRYAPMHNPHVTFVRNVANLAAERIWVVYDRGDRENARLLALAPERTAYLFDERPGRTYLYDPSAKP